MHPYAPVPLLQPGSVSRKTWPLVEFSSPSNCDHSFPIIVSTRKNNVCRSHLIGFGRDAESFKGGYPGKSNFTTWISASFFVRLSHSQNNRGPTEDCVSLGTCSSWCPASGSGCLLISESTGACGRLTANHRRRPPGVWVNAFDDVVAVSGRCRPEVWRPSFSQCVRAGGILLRFDGPIVRCCPTRRC